MRSLKRQLIGWLSGLLALVAVFAGIVAYSLMREDTSSFLDRQLQLVAGSIDEGSRFDTMQADFLTANPQKKNKELVLQVWLGQSATARTSRPGFDLPRGKTTGFSHGWLHEKKWRIYTIVYPDRTVQVSQSVDVRHDIAKKTAALSLVPFAVLIPLSWLIISIGVGRILKPLGAMAEALTKRDAFCTTPLPAEDVPEEISPLIGAMNTLLLRLRETLELQRHFISDAAHELRTPLAALQLQIDSLFQDCPPADFESRIGALKSGVRRASHLVNQLLKMARHEAKKETLRAEIDLASFVKTRIADFIPVAEKRGIDLGMVRDESVSIQANADDLRNLIDNLLDNAVRYAFANGRVDVSVAASAHQAVIEIVDTGPGIPEHLLSSVFDRFFRVAGQEAEGSGIGLSIAKTIADRESATITLTNRTDRKGLKAAIHFSRKIERFSQC